MTTCPRTPADPLKLEGVADDLEKRAPDVAELRTSSTWHADEDDDPLFDSRREYLEQIDPDGSRARF
jgi:hypothetical protein